ncbi:hypothetical protein OIPHN260_13910 [Enterobacter roggenkampii]|uniref:Ferrienterobactin-binding periplasmic protein n=1 Tax=Enterobacter roggenkampii TaxID=1812935 RepID=A0AAU9BAF3_9ENTR|nr:hypothetical protein OIPHN260_13910 [Enterobacter roggenkampii]
MKFPAVFRNPLLLLSLFVLGLTSAAAADWPRQVTDSRGVHTLESKPTRIVSTSVTLTGSLLAIDAPVVASGATTPNNRVADGQGFLRQWGDMAKQRKVARLYIGEPSAEAVAAQMPDLILISATGGGFRAGAVRSAFRHCADAYHQLRRQELAGAADPAGRDHRTRKAGRRAHCRV